MCIILVIYVLLINVTTLILFGIDKYKAIYNRYRISEMTLLTFAMLGGSLGANLGMKLFRHKTKHKKFRVLLPIMFIFHIGILIYLKKFMQ